MNEKSKSYVIKTFKIIIVIIAYLYIYYKLKDFDFSNLLGSNSIWYLIFAFLFMFDNWGIEALKWQILIKRFNNIDLITSYKSVFSGITTAVLTPNRVGEFLGRLAYISEQNRAKAILATFVGSYAQILTTLFAGLIAMSFSKKIIYNGFVINSQFNLLILSVIVFFSVIIYFKISIISHIFKKIFKSNKINKIISEFEKYTATELCYILFLSFLRYVIFSGQLILLGIYFNLDLNIKEMFIALSQFYLLLMIIPTISLAEPGIRGFIAVSVFSQYTNNQEIVIITISVLWLINVVIPAIIGSFVIFGNKKQKSLPAS